MEYLRTSRHGGPGPGSGIVEAESRERRTRVGEASDDTQGLVVDSQSASVNETVGRVAFRTEQASLKSSGLSVVKLG